MGVRDDELVTAALDGDPGAFAALVERNRSRIHAVVGRMVGEEAEDVVQEALLRAYLGLSQLRDPRSFDAWLCGIAVNLAKMRLRQRAVERRLVAEAASDEGGQERELLDLVRDAVDVLPRGQRDVVLMHYVEGLSCEEIASLLHSSPGAIRVRLHRAREQLRAQLAPLVSTRKKEMVMLEMRVEDVLVRVSDDDPPSVVSEQRVVLLREADGDRRMPIWIGAAEGNALALRLTGATTPRPLTTDLMVDLLRVTGARVDRVAVTGMRDDTFYAVIGVAVNGSVEDLDARPSDALNLAVRVSAPIFVDDGVLAQSAIQAGDLGDQLDRQARDRQWDTPGEWRSVSTELVSSLYQRR
jgi:RNA polymerase sigma factor (sigma-70 family)